MAVPAAGNTNGAVLRMDAVLFRLRLVPSREQAKRACENGIVELNGKVAKPSSSVRSGDFIRVRFTDEDLRFTLIELPRKSMSKTSARSCYAVTASNAVERG